MSLRHALLALVSGGPLTGYDAVKHFRTSVGHLWHAPDSQIYPELRRMRVEGLLEATEVPWGTKSATKTQYSLTDRGREALEQWQRTPLSYAPDRDHAHLLAAYFEWGSRESAAQRLHEHIEFFTRAQESAENQAQEIRDRSSSTLQRRFAHTDPRDWDRIAAFKLFAYEGKVASAQAEIAWAREGLALLEQIDAESSSGAPIRGSRGTT